MQRKISMVVLLAMLTAIVTSCAGGTDVVTDDSKAPAVTTDPVETIPEEERLELDGISFTGKNVNILTYQGLMVGSGEDTASALSRATYTQQVRTEDRLGVTITFNNITAYRELPGMVTQSINTNTDDYQLVFGAASTIVGLINSGYFVSANDLPHVNLDKVWWNRGYSESVSINENDPYVLFGDICYNMIDRTCAVLFNKDLLLEHHGMTDSELYDIVLDGKWTIDKLAELSVGLYIDNGDNNNNMEDLHGITFNGEQEFNYLAYSAGIPFTGRDEKGYPMIKEAPSERMVELVDKLLPIFNGEGAFPNGSLPASSYATKFGEGRALFLPSRIYTANWNQIKDMEDDYGIIPMPKFDETIDGYHSAVGNLVVWGLVPQTVVDLDLSSAVAESLAYEGNQNTTPVYYEENLKLKTTRGDDVETESEIIDMIRYGAQTDFMYISPLGNLSNIFTSCYLSNENRITSAYASAYSAAQTIIAQTVATLEAE